MKSREEYKSRSEWYHKISREIDSHRSRLSPEEQKKYKLDYLLRLAGRIDEFYPMCGRCQVMQQDVTQLSRDLWDTALMPKGWHKEYSRKLNAITKHLQKEHKLVTEGQYAGMWIGIGVAIGVGISAAAGLEGGGIAIGAAIGTAVGYFLDRKAKREGRVI